MYYHLKTKHGNTEVVIDDNCGISTFYEIAGTLSSELNIEFLSHADHAYNAETLHRDFMYKNQLLTLQYNVFNGVSVFPRHGKSVLQENNVVMEIAHFLERLAY